MLVVLFKQTVIMFLLMFLGMFLYKRNYIDNNGTEQIGKILVKIILPVVIIRAFWGERTPEKTRVLILTFAVSIAALLLSSLLALLLCRKDRVAEYACAVGNSGFIGLPLVAAVCGEDALFYITAHITLGSVLQCTWLLYRITGDKTMVQPKNLLTNVITLSFAASCLLYFFNVPEPEILRSVLDYLAAINTPLVMIIVGAFLAQTKAKDLFTSFSLYRVSLIRLLVIPLITLVMFLPIPIEKEAAIAILICCAAPCATNTAIFAQQYGKNYPYACQIVCVSTLLALVTLPLFVGFAEAVL